MYDELSYPVSAETVAAGVAFAIKPRAAPTWRYVKSESPGSSH